MPRTIRDAQTVASDLMAELGPLIAGERAAFAQRCHERSISMSHLHLMTLLESFGPLPMGRVAEMLGSGLPTATGMVTRMEERGLVERVHDTDDRRVVLVRLTAEGETDLQQIQVERARRMALALDHLSDAERTELLSSIRALRAAFARVNHEHGVH
ncbi:MAG: MarR family transcriptional regulator [Candidatus Limnocylindria bacterium]